MNGGSNRFRGRIISHHSGVEPLKKLAGKLISGSTLLVYDQRKTVVDKVAWATKSTERD